DVLVERGDRVGERLPRVERIRQALECMGDRLGLCGVHELEDRSQVDVLATVLDGRASSAAGGLPLVGGAEAGAVRDACVRGAVRIRRGRLPTARALVLVSDLM